MADENIFNDILSNDCSISIQETDVANQTEEDWFKLHPVTLEIHRKTDSLYPECQKSNEWNTNKILESIMKWKTSLTRNPNLHWFHEPSREPLDLSQPKLKINLNLFENRQHYNQRNVSIQFSGRNTVTGVMRNGFIQIDLPIDIAKKEEWRDPIQIIFKNEGIQTPNMDNVFESSELFVTGRLKHGQLDGFVVMNGMLSNDPEGICQEIIFPRLGFVGHFKNGIPSGICWRELEGGAWIYGQVDNKRKFTGDNIAYIYPDMKIALIGQFNNGLMVNGRQTEVTGERCNEMGIKELRFGEPVGPVFHYDPPNHESFGDQPLIGDPLDNYYIELKPSLIYPNAGEGAHAKVDVPAHTVISLYGGRLLTKDQMESFKNELQQKFDKNNWNGLHPEVVASWKYRHQLSSCEMTIDIPGEFEPVSKYRGTIGHKVNHSFKPNCQYLPIDSPRFGQILSVKTFVPVAKGEEFLASYGYSFTAGPLWYKDLFLQFMEEHPNEHDAIQRISLGKSREELQEMYNEYLKTATKSFASIGIGELETIEEKK